MTQLKATHQFYIVYIIETLVPLEHSLPRPLVGVGVSLSYLTTLGKYNLLHTIHGIFGIGSLLTHGIAILACIALKVVVVILIAKLGIKFQTLEQSQLGIKLCHDGTVLTHL